MQHTGIPDTAPSPTQSSNHVLSRGERRELPQHCLPWPSAPSSFLSGRFVVPLFSFSSVADFPSSRMPLPEIGDCTPSLRRTARRQGQRSSGEQPIVYPVPEKDEDHESKTELRAVRRDRSIAMYHNELCRQPIFEMDTTW